MTTYCPVHGENAPVLFAKHGPTCLRCVIDRFTESCDPIDVQVERLTYAQAFERATVQQSLGLPPRRLL